MKSRRTIVCAGVAAWLATVLSTLPLFAQVHRAMVSGRVVAPVAGESDPAPLPPGMSPVQPATFIEPSMPAQLAQFVSPAVPMTTGYVPRHLRMAQAQTPVIMQPTPAGMQPGVTMIQPGETIVAPGTEMMDGGMVMQPGEQIVGNFQGDMMYPGMAGCDDCGVPCDCDGVMCDTNCAAPDRRFVFIPVPVLSLERFSAFGGVHAYTGPANLVGPFGAGSSFGFHYGLAWGAPLIFFPESGFGMQLGAQSTHSDFSHPDYTRNQFFATGGIFRRVEWGFQGGIVVDYMHDSWYTDDTALNLLGMRGELSFKGQYGNEIGFWFSAGTNDPSELGQYSFVQTDLYAFFFRRRLDCLGGADGRIFAGWTGEKDGLIGAEVQTAINNGWALDVSFTYLIPDQEYDDQISGNRTSRGTSESTWCGIPWCTAGSARAGRFSPLFRVADNGTFMLDLVPVNVLRRRQRPLASPNLNSSATWQSPPDALPRRPLIGCPRHPRFLTEHIFRRPFKPPPSSATALRHFPQTTTTAILVSVLPCGR